MAAEGDRDGERALGAPGGELLGSVVASGALRLYAGPSRQPTVRRATDVVLLVPALVGLALLVASQPPSGVERALIDLLATLPGWLDPVWEVAYDLLALWSVLLLVAAVATRRYRAFLQALTALILAIAIALVSTRIAAGSWPAILDAVRGGTASPTFPAVRVAEAAAVTMTSAPLLTSAMRRLARWIVGLGAGSVALLAVSTPAGMLAALLIAAVAAACVRLAFGTSAGRLGVDDVVAALAALDVGVARLDISQRQVAGVLSLEGEDGAGRPLAIKVYGRDAYDNQLLEKLWRTAWYRDGGPSLGLSAAQSAEHEALITLLARGAGVPTREVVTAGIVGRGDSLLVLAGGGRPLAASRDELGDATLDAAWNTLGRLNAARIAHLRIDPYSVVVDGDAVRLVDLGWATVAASADQVLTDRAQLLAATAAVAGSDAAVAAARRALGDERVAELLPYLQDAAFGRALGQALAAAELDADDLRAAAAQAVGADAPELARLRRVSWASAIESALLVLAAAAILTGLSGIDFAQVREDVSGANWAIVALAALVAQTPRLFQAASTQAAVPARLPFGPVYAMQLAIGFMNVALPSSLARMAVNIRFFQRQGVTPAAAVTAGAIDSFAGNALQVVLLGLLLLFGNSSLDLQLDHSLPSGAARVLVALLVGAVAAVLAVAVVPRLRRAVVGRVRRWWPEVRSALATLRRSNRLARLVLANLAVELLFAAALGLFARSLGYEVAFGDLLLINISVSLFASLIPVPGGIGVVEGGLMVGLTAAGLPESSAFAVAILYRLATFYLPPLWGWFALRWLQRHRYL